jgi:hypothetical protein
MPDSSADPLLEALLRTTLPPRLPQIALEIAPRVARGQREADYALALHNRGDGAVTLLLRADDPQRLLGYEFGRERIELAPGQTAHLPLTVEAPRRLLGPAVSVPFAVFAQPEGGEPVAAQAGFLHQSMLPTWVLVALLVAAMLVLLTLLVR